MAWAPLELGGIGFGVSEEVSVDISSHKEKNCFVYVDRLWGRSTIDGWNGRDLCTKDVI